jgi:hypothetical protein
MGAMVEGQIFISVGELPDDPRLMPPPYWRGGGSWLQLDDALSSLVNLLYKLVEVTPVVREKLRVLRMNQADSAPSDEFGEELRHTCEPAWRIENEVLLKCELSILMAAIHAEELVNRFCVYNLPRELVDTIEKLSPAEKLTAAASHLGHAQVRSKGAYAALVDLFRWRNAFAHGHCVDRPTKSLRHNHLITPDGQEGLPGSITTVVRQVLGFARLAEYLAEISVNPYTASAAETASFTAYRVQIERFKVTGSPILYDVNLAE